MVIGALDVDHLAKAAFELGDVVGHIGHEVGVGAVGLAHHAVLVVPVIGGLEPQGTVLLVGLAGGDQLVDRGLHPAAGVQAGLEVVVVELHLEGLEVQVLLMAQVGHGELPDAVQVVSIAAAGELAVVRLDGLAGQEIGGDVANVVAVVGRLGPAGVTGLEALGTALGAVGQGLDLHAGIVVIELTPDIPALGLEQVADGVAQCGLAPVPHVQRAGRVGRDELDQHALVARRLPAELLAGLQHLTHHLLLGGGLEAHVQEARAGDLNRVDPLRPGRGGHQRGLEGLGHLTRVELEGLGQLHGRGAGEIAVRRHLGRLEDRLGTGTGGEFIELGRQRSEQIVFDRKHGVILRGGA